MTYKGVIAASMLCALAFLFALIICEQCKAADAGGDVSKEVMSKHGIEGLFKGKGKWDPRSPNGWQMALGIGGFFVTIAVMKYL